MKITQWFEMQSTFEGTPEGQADEGIDIVEWVHPNDIAAHLENSYENIKLLFENKKSL